MENLNSCCFVATINEVKSIEGADNIEQVVVGGWNAITKKGEFKQGDLTVIATTDAVIPEAFSEKMGVTSYLRKGGRVRTVKLRGVYSECLIIPTKYIPGYGDRYQDGDDMMEKFGIYKYEPPVRQVQLAGGRKIKYKDNPNFHVYYKFPNLKNVAGLFTEEDEVQITRKIHGTNARYGIVKKNKLSFWDKVKKFFRIADKWVDYEFVIGSHNVEKGSDSQGYYDINVWYEIADKYNIKNKLWQYVKLFDYGPKDIGSGIILYGEIYGKGIQKGYDYGLNEILFAGFDVMENGKYLDTEVTTAVVRSFVGLPHVEILYEGKWNQEIQDSFVFNNFIEGTKTPHEGVVVKHISGNRQKVAKCINPEYLLFEEKHILDTDILYNH
jgi:RNA ligase (TIGR02306 family)